MPELPEVQTQVTDLKCHLLGRKITKIETNTPKLFRGGLKHFQKNLLHQKIQDITRQGKYILFHFPHQITMVVHFRMTGHFLLQTHSDQYKDEKCIRATFTLDNGQKLLYQDIRKFGRFWVGPHSQVLDSSNINSLGPDPLDPNFTLTDFRERLSNRRGYLKPLLLNQSFLAGIGNIYADESLFLSRLHPLRRAESLSPNEIRNLYHAIRTSLASGVKNRGTTIGEYVSLNNEQGTNQNHLNAYRRHDNPCPNCKTPLQRIIVAQRGTTICPHCQKIPK